MGTHRLGWPECRPPPAGGVCSTGLAVYTPYMATKACVVSVRVSEAFYVALTRAAADYGLTVSEFTKSALSAAMTAPTRERSDLMQEAGMAHELDDGLRELAAVGQRLLKVRAQLTLKHPDDWNPADGPPQSTLPVAFRGEGNAPTRDNPIVTRTPPDPDPEDES